jgi:hypothetical protein
MGSWIPMSIGQPGLDELDWIAETAQKPGTTNHARYCDWFDYHRDLKQMEAEVRKVSTIRSRMGWSQARHFKRIASFPLHVFALFRRVDKDFARNTPDGIKRLYRVLARRPEFRAD